MDELRKIRFPRCVILLEGQFKKPLLMVFGDRSREACCSFIYLQWEWDDGQVLCRLVTGKTQVAPKVKITIPRMELVVAVNSVRLARKVRVIEDPSAGTRYCTDSSAVLGMLRTESGRFTEFMGARVRGSQSEQQHRRRMAVAHGKLQLCRPGVPIYSHPQRHGCMVRISRWDDVDERTGRGMAMQEIFRPCTRRKDEAGYVLEGT
jgi:hypothetical protein